MIEFHPLANIFPLIEGQEFDDLVKDIRTHGLREPIILLQNKILDGRNRYRACVTAGLLPESLDTLTVPQLKYFKHHVAAGHDAPSDDELFAFVLSKNLHRRHLSASQRAMAMAEYEEYRHGGARRGPVQDANLHLEGLAPVEKDRPTRSDLAERGHVSERLLASAAVVRDHAIPALKEVVRQGGLAVTAIEEIAQQPAERQAEIVASLPRDAAGKLTPEAKKALAPIVKEIRKEKIIAKKERRAEREAETGLRIQNLPGNFFGVAIEDFEWHHKAWSGETGAERSPSMHYETAEDAQTPEAIVARCAERFECLADTCILFKWTTQPHLAIALKVLELQGFEYVTNLVWNKERNGAARGHGYWFTGEHELVLVGVRGNVVPPATAHFRSSFSAPVGGHSEKPDKLHEIIEFHWPNTPKVEFNARKRRPGWAVWGNQAPIEAAA